MRQIIVLLALALVALLRGHFMAVASALPERAYESA